MSFKGLVVIGEAGAFLILSAIASSSTIAIILAALIAALGSIGAAFLTVRNSRKLDEVHVLVNGRLDHALVRIDELEVRLLAARGAAQETSKEIHERPSPPEELFDPDNPHQALHDAIATRDHLLKQPRKRPPKKPPKSDA